MTAPRTPGFALRVIATDGHARAGVLTTPHGEVPLPTFMPVGTQGTVKTLTPDEVASTGARIVLGNTYHLSQRPGAEVIAALGGLHGFARWPHAMLTDSGGYQAYSLAGPPSRRRGKAAELRSLVKPSEDGFTFRSHIDGTKLHLSPEEAVRVQGLLGADIQMQLDVCPPGGSEPAVVEAAVLQTTRWAKRALAAPRPANQAIFGLCRAGRLPACAGHTPMSSPPSTPASTGWRSEGSRSASPSRRCTRRSPRLPPRWTPSALAT